MQDILDAIRWAQATLVHIGSLLASSDEVSLAAIADAKVLAAARRMLSDLGKPDASAINVADASAITDAFASALLSGTGSSSRSPRATRNLRRVIGSLVDRSGGGQHEGRALLRRRRPTSVASSPPPPRAPQRSQRLRQQRRPHRITPPAAPPAKLWSRVPALPGDIRPPRSDVRLMLAESAIAGHGTVLLIDDEEGTGRLVRRHFPGWTVIQALTLADGRDQLASLPEVCLVLLDLNLPDTLYPQPLHASPFQGSFDLARHLRDTHPGLPVVIFSAHCDATVINAAHLAGAELISKHDAAANLDLLRSRLDRAALPAPGSPATYLDWLRDHRGLSPRERDVADLAVQGMTRYADIGDALGISPNTVKRHVTHLLDRAGVDSLFDFIFRAHGIAPRSLQRPSGLRP